MSIFRYVTSSTSGEKNTGTIEASNLEQAQQKLQKQNKLILSLEEYKQSFSFRFWQKPHLSLTEKLMLTKHLSMMIGSGINITEAFHIIISQTEKQKNRKMFENILERIHVGQSLSESLREYDSVFSNIYINMIATGEKSGRLEEVLQQLETQLEKEDELRKKVISAFIYPAVIIGITILLTIGIVVFIMPKITGIFASFDIQLPLITRMLIGFSTFITKKPLLFILIVAAIIGGLSWLFKSKTLKPFWHRVILLIPIFGKIIIDANLARISRTLHSLLEAGVPITKALDITTDMVDHVIYKKALQEAREKVEQGAKLGECFTNYKRIFPQIMSHMLTIGGKTGSLEKTTEHLATLYENNVDRITKNLSVLLEPILLLFMGVLVGGIALAIILPIYQLPRLLE